MTTLALMNAEERLEIRLEATERKLLRITDMLTRLMATDKEQAEILAEQAAKIHELERAENARKLWGRR